MAAVTPLLAAREGCRSEIPLDSARTHPDLRRHRSDAPPVAVQRPDLLIRRLPARLALGRARLGRRGRAWGWHGHRNRPIGPRYGVLTPRVIDRVANLAMCGEDLGQRFCQVLEQRQTIGDLERCGCSWGGAIGGGFRPITRDHLPPRMLPEPVRPALSGAIREERHRLAAFQIDEHRARGLTVPHREIVHTEHGGSGPPRDRQPAEHAQDGATADGHAQATAELCTRSPTQGHGDGHEPVEEAFCPPGPRRHHTGQSRGQEAA